MPSKFKPNLRFDGYVDPRLLSKYLDLLQKYKTQEEKELQIINWYYTEEVNLYLKESLMIIVSKLPNFLKLSEVKVKEVASQGDALLSEGILQLHTLVSNNNFEDIDKVRDRILKRLKTNEDKSEIFGFTAEIYSNIGVISKSISNQKKALEYNKFNFSSIMSLVRMYINFENFDLAEEIIIDSVKLFRKRKPENLPELFNILSQSKIYSSKFLEAKQILLQAKEIHTDNSHLKTLIDINLILVLVLNYELDEAWKMINHVGLSIDTNFNAFTPHPLQYTQIPYLYNTIAMFYSVSGQFQKAKDFAEKSSKIDGMLGNTKFSQPYHFLIYSNNLAYLSIYLGEDENFYKYNQIVRDLSVDFFESNSFAFAKSYANQGLMFLMKGNKDLAFQNFFRSFNMLAKSKTRGELIRSAIYCDIGNVYCWQKDYLQAKIFYQKSKKIIELNFGKNSLNLQRINSKIRNINNGQNIILPF